MEYKNSFQLSPEVLIALINKGDNFKIKAKININGNMLKLAVNPSQRLFSLDSVPSIQSTDVISGLTASELKFWANFLEKNGFGKV